MMDQADQPKGAHRDFRKAPLDAESNPSKPDPVAAHEQGHSGDRVEKVGAGLHMPERINGEEPPRQPGQSPWASEDGQQY